MMAFVREVILRSISSGSQLKLASSTSTNTGRGAGSRDASRGGEEGEAWADHFVTRSYAQRHERDEEGIGAGGDSDGMLGAAVARAFLLKGFDLGSENEIAAPEDPSKGVLQLRLELWIESF